jgi:hypothetical protein
MSKGIRARLAVVQQQLADMDEAAAQHDQLDMSAIDWTDNASQQIWDSLHIEKKRAWIRSSMDVVLHRHYRGSARVFDPGTVQILIKHSPEGGASVENVAQWKQMNPPGQEPKLYNVMMQPGFGPGLPFTQTPPR